MDHRIFTGKTCAGLAIAAVALLSWAGMSPPSTAGAAPPDAASAERPPDELRVCADPNNLPFSNRAQEGFHNELANFFAQELGLSSVSYEWWPQRRGFVRNTLKKKKCDVIFGVPEGYDILQSTKPFYRSPYVFLYRADAGFEVNSLDDPVLRDLKIGVNLIGDDYMNPPPAHALGARGIVGNVKGFAVYGDYDEDSPPRKIVEAVAEGDVELAIVWGPVAGYWAQRQDVEMTIEPLPAVDDSTGFPLAYNMSLGVRRGEEEWQARLEKVIEENHQEIYDILEQYHVPLLALNTQGGGSDEGVPADGAARGNGGDPEAAATPSPMATLAAASGSGASADGPAARPGGGSRPDGRVPLASVLQGAEDGAAQDTPVSETVYNGWKWFMVYCTRCHGETGTGSTIAPSLLEAVDRQTFTRDSFVTTVIEGRPDKGMPAWNQLLDADQAHAIFQYIDARTDGLTAGRPESPRSDSVSPGGD